MVGWLRKYMEKNTDGWMDKKNRWMVGWMDREKKMDGWMDKKIYEKNMDGWMDKKKY